MGLEGSVLPCPLSRMIVGVGSPPKASEYPNYGFLARFTVIPGNLNTLTGNQELISE